MFEAHTGVIGNVGFLGIPMLALLGPQAVGPVLLVLAVDLIVFSSILTMAITGLRAGRVSAQTFGILGMGLVKNPMIVSTVLGSPRGSTGLALPAPVNEFLTLGPPRRRARFSPSVPRFPAGRRNGSRLRPGSHSRSWSCTLRQAAACWLFGVTGYPAGVMTWPPLPVAGNVFILAQHYRVAPQRGFNRDPFVHGRLGPDRDSGDRPDQPGGLYMKTVSEKPGVWRRSGRLHPCRTKHRLRHDLGSSRLEQAEGWAGPAAVVSLGPGPARTRTR